MLKGLHKAYIYDRIDQSGKAKGMASSFYAMMASNFGVEICYLNSNNDREAVEPNNHD